MATLGGRTHSRLAGADRRLRPHPRAHRARRPRLHAVQPPRPPAGRFLPAERPARGDLPDASRGARASPCTPSPSTSSTDGQLLLTTIRSHDQFNTTIYGENDRYRGIHGGRRVVFLNARRHARASDSQSDQLGRPGEPLRRRAPARRALQGVPYEIPRGCAAAYYPETNVLVPVAAVADGSNQPASKSIVITIEPRQPAAAAV